MSTLREIRLRKMVRIKKRVPDTTLVEFALMFGISRERVRQIIDTLEGPDRELFRYVPKEYPTIQCKRCGKEVNAKRNNQIYCDRNCQVIYKTSEERHEGINTRIRERYNTHPEVRARHAQQYKEYLIRMKKDPIRLKRYKEGQSRAVKRYYEKKKRERNG